DHGVGEGARVDGEVALKHGARRPKRLEAGFNVGPPGGGQCLRRWWLGVVVETEAADVHAETAEFDVDVGTAGQRLDRRRPLAEQLVAIAGIAANAERPADVIQHDLAGWKGAGELGQFIGLGVIEPGIVAEPKPGEHGKALAERRFPDQAGRRVIGGIAHQRVGIPGTAVADAAKAVAASLEVGFEHRLDPTAEGQIGVADDAGAVPRRALNAAGAPGGGARWGIRLPRPGRAHWCAGGEPWRDPAPTPG